MFKGAISCHVLGLMVQTDASKAEPDGLRNTSLVPPAPNLVHGGLTTATWDLRARSQIKREIRAKDLVVLPNVVSHAVHRGSFVQRTAHHHEVVKGPDGEVAHVQRMV